MTKECSHLLIRGAYPGIQCSKPVKYVDPQGRGWCALHEPDAARKALWEKGATPDVVDLELRNLIAAAERAIPLLIRLGDFIGNGENGTQERCETISALRDAIAGAQDRVLENFHRAEGAS